MQKTVSLFGGSFNPPHEGHMGMATYTHHALRPDETWMLFSENPWKNPDCYAPLEHRIAMAEILAKNYDAPLVMSGIEAEIAAEKGRHETWYILQGLSERFPDTKFIWVMGADTFSDFHKWDERNDILKNYIVAVVDRPGFTEKAMNSPTAIEFAQNKFDVSEIENVSNGWCFLDSPKIPASSTGILEQIASGKRDFSPAYAEVADYIYKHGLYGTSRSAKLEAA